MIKDHDGCVLSEPDLIPGGAAEGARRKRLQHPRLADRHRG